MKKMNKKRILYISSRPPYYSAGLAEDSIKIFERMGYDVDFLTLYPFIGQKRNQYNVSPRPIFLIFRQLREKYPWLAFFRKIYHKLLYSNFTSSKNNGYSCSNDKIFIPCENERIPPVEIDEILKEIRSDYDYIVTQFWQDMITAATLEAIYMKTKVPIVCCVPDQYPFTGNCYYPSYCKEYKNECINCPVFINQRNPQQAHLNYLYKKQIYTSVPCYFTANSYTKKFILETNIVAEEQIILKSFTLDTDVFRPIDIDKCRRYLKISDKKRFILLMRYMNPNSESGLRKGIPNAIEAINEFTSTLTKYEKEEVLLLLIGVDHVSEYFRTNIDVDIQCLGYVNRNGLIKAYNVSSIFLSPSLDDAGPSMVNQAMACGTPVVSFEIGTALDVVKNHKTGYMAKFADNKDLAFGISSIYKLNHIEYQQMRIDTRNMALEMNSIQSAERIYKKVFKDLEKYKE